MHTSDVAVVLSDVTAYHYIYFALLHRIEHFETVNSNNKLRIIRFYIHFRFEYNFFNTNEGLDVTNMFA